MKHSIRNRLIFGTLLTVALVLAAITVIVGALVGGAVRDQFDDGLRAKAQELAAQIEDNDGELENEVDPRTLAAGEAYELWVRGKPVAKSNDHLELVAAPIGSPLTEVTLDGRAARQYTVRSEARVEGSDPNGAMPIVFVLARTTAEVDAAAHHITVVIVGVGLAGLVLCVMFVLLVVRHALSPMRDLATAIAGIRASDLAIRLAPQTTAVELASVANRLDELLARLGAAFARERDLTAEVAHELRTPLAGLRATLELALDRERPAERYRTALEQSLAITRETERLVESLLSLARLDAGQTALHAMPLDLDQLVRDALDKVHTRVTERGLTLVTELKPVTLTSDRDKLRVVIANLLDNATTYCDAGGEVRVTLSEAELRVSNTGCTLTPEEVGRVFERFWRGDVSRSPEGHTGIGMSLTQKLVELLGGSVAVEVNHGRFVATVQLPR
ncbi:MAG TPA: ATP-binding protein [Kofleriaceae bacterium]|nr:ATP-binding protein [Kofleriaceae bacterium]